MDQKLESSASASTRLPDVTRRLAGRAAARLGELGLSAKLLLLTLSFVMLAEILIFVPSVANFRINWLLDRLAAAQLASLAAEASPTGSVPQPLQNELLRTAQVRSVVVKRSEQRQLIIQTEMPETVDVTYDLTSLARGGPGPSFMTRLEVIVDALRVFTFDGRRMLRIVGRPGDQFGDTIEIVLPEAPLRSAMVRFALNILGLSIIISVITAALVYMALNKLLVQPMMRIASNMLRFSENPEDKSRIIVPSRRADEIGTAERELANMQSELSQLLNQKNRLAALGLAVSKINHDLRNLLANTQLLSDRLASSPDPTVQRFAPKLIASLDRAISFCNDTLRFGRAAERAPEREMIALLPLVEDVADGLGLPRGEQIAFRTDIDAGLRIDVDREHLFRILTNLVRNAVQALEGRPGDARGTITVSAIREGRTVRVSVADDGPGVPAKARENLFKAFQGSVRKGGTGLGLAIAYELATAHGGALVLEAPAKGALFSLSIPDRGADGQG